MKDHSLLFRRSVCTNEEVARINFPGCCDVHVIGRLIIYARISLLRRVLFTSKEAVIEVVCGALELSRVSAEMRRTLKYTFVQERRTHSVRPVC